MIEKLLLLSVPALIAASLIAANSFANSYSSPEELLAKVESSNKKYCPRKKIDPRYY